ncbi:uncharacterized protein LOC121429946 [Lytechinus variegatus]|uniref:uncharacterized protein LOC121429946 n=1 Tax=Lytechinus variegatus TaxID=7654 RepID=UPI001BB21F88|nr:uncharacterized protein LOC121429946 [Lytechinus variegatus]
MSSDKQALHPDAYCHINISEGRKHMKMSDIEHLAMLKAKAEKESGNFSCVDVFKVLLFIGVICTFTVVFYKIAVLQQNVRILSSRMDRIQITQNAQGNVRQCNCTDSTQGLRDKPRGNTRRYSMGMGRSGRNRRSLSDGQQESEHEEDNVIDTQIPKYGDRFSAHLLPKDGNSSLKEGQIFEWVSTKNHSFIEASGFELVDDRYLLVPVAGYYFVYSQVTFNDSLTRTIGHQLIVYGSCGRRKASIIMGSAVTQQIRPDTDLSHSGKKDSSYVGGVVYLAAGDYLAVRPNFGDTRIIEYSRSDPDSFFGAFMLKRDSEGKSLMENCI